MDSHIDVLKELCPVLAIDLLAARLSDSTPTVSIANSLVSSWVSCLPVLMHNAAVMSCRAWSTRGIVVLELHAGKHAGRP